MKINGYDINYDEAELKDKMENQTLDIRLISPDFEGYKNLSEGNKKALTHLVAAARMVNDVALEQDHPMNLPQKKALAEAAAAGSSHAALALELFNSLNGVAGYNGVDKEPVEVFAGIRLLPGHNFYPADLSPEEFRQILIAMLKAGKSEEVRKILSARTMVRRAGGELKAIDYTEYFAAAFRQLPTSWKWPPIMPTTKHLRIISAGRRRRFCKTIQTWTCWPTDIGRFCRTRRWSLP